jgi:hypothetical protein
MHTSDDVMRDSARNPIKIFKSPVGAGLGLSELISRGKPKVVLEWPQCIQTRESSQTRWGPRPSTDAAIFSKLGVV